MRWGGSPDGVAGFTLLELLLAMFIFAIVVTSVYGAYRQSFQTIDTAERQVERATVARVVLERLHDDLGSLVLGEEALLVAQETTATEAGSLHFLSSLHLRFSPEQPRAGRAYVTYTTEENPETGLLDLYRADQPALPGVDEEEIREERGFLLAKNLHYFRVDCVADDGEESPTWDSRGDEAGVVPAGMPPAPVLPVLIRFAVGFGAAGEEAVTHFRSAVALPARQGEAE